MKIILTQDVPPLGRKDDLKDVADGYARNFLIPRGFAVPASKAALGAWESRRQNREKAATEDLTHAAEAVKKLDGYELEIVAKANEDGTLYSAVGSEEILAALASKGFAMENAVMRGEEPLKTLGEHKVVAEFPHKLEASVTVRVNPEKLKKTEEKKRKSPKKQAKKTPAAEAADRTAPPQVL